MKKENAEPKINVQLDSCVTSQGICAFIADVQNTKNAQVKCQKLLSRSQNQISFIQTDSVQILLKIRKSLESIKPQICFLIIFISG